MRKMSSGKRKEKRASRTTPGQMPDYSVYILSRKERALLLGAGLGLTAAVSYLFYRSWIAFLILLPLAWLVVREGREYFRLRRQQLMRGRFLAGMELVTMSLQSGYAVENAFREALRELKRIYEEEDFVVAEFRHIVRGIDLNETIESLLTDLGRRSDVEDIRSFAQVFTAAKRTGGDLIAVIRNTVVSMQQKDETLLEIETVLAGKKLEQRIMCLAPLLILGYVSVTSPESLEIMYRSAAGIAVMTVCLLVYAGAAVWSSRIMDIRI